MVTFQDASIGLSPAEASYGTNTTVDRWYEFLDESLQFQKNIKQGQGLRVGGRVARSARRVVPTADGGGDISLEAISKGMGRLWTACMGTGATALVSGSTQQQLFTLGDTPPSHTVQLGLPRVDGTVDAYTYVGGMVGAWTLNFPNADIANLSTTWDFKDMVTATAYAAPSYAAAPVNLFHFAGGSVAGGTLTAPTTTALASGTTVIGDVRGGSVSVNNNLAVDRLNLGASGRKAKPAVGLREISAQVTVEYDVATYRDAVLNDTPAMLILNFTAGALSTGLETIQIVIPEYKLDAPLAQVNGTALITTDLSVQVLDNLTAAQPLWVVCRTADSAL